MNTKEDTLPVERKHVLLADDDHEDFLIFQLAVDQLPFAVLLTHAEDGEQLIKMLEQMLPDIIFLDIHMPCKDGRECIRDIRSNKKFDMVPVIMYTSQRYDDYVEETYRSGANFYLVKPHDIKELAEKIKMLLSINWKQYMYYPTRDNYVIAS